MKKILLLLVLMIFTLNFSLSGQNIKSNGSALRFFNHDSKAGLKELISKAGHNIKVEWNEENSTPIVVEGKLTQSGYSVSADKSNDAVRFLSENSQLFGLSNASQELKLISSFTDELLMVHLKYDQYVNGIKVYPSQLVVHFNSDGSIQSVNGNYIPTPILPDKPLISSGAAISIAKNKIGQNGYDKESAELILFRNNIKLLPAYMVKLPSRQYPNMTVWIDASTGEFIRKDDGLRYDGPVVGSGIGLNGQVKQLNTYLLQGKYYLLDASLPMYVPPIDSLKGVVATYDAHNDTSGNGYNSATLITDPNNDNNFNDNIGLRAAVDAHAFAQVVYKFYRSHYDRQSFNNAGASLLNVVHYKKNYNNAFWNGSVMSYGDGDGVAFSNLAGANDVIAHELTHAVTEYTANLVYHVQPGAINEHISDVFGVLVDSTDWLMGEDVYTPGIPGDALRNMQDPHNGAQPGSNEWQPANMSEYVILADDEDHDWGGVHINSGIPNKAFYNVASQLNHFKAGKIWYRALTVYLTTNSQFNDLRASCLLGAKDLFGESSNEYNVVKAGFDAVGITGGGGGNITEILYDDDNPGTYVWETAANWRLALKFTAPSNNFEVQKVKIYIAGDGNNGSGHFTLEMFDANNSGLPGNALINPYSYTPAIVGWQTFTVTNLTLTKDFFVSVKYDGVNYAGIGADNPPGNQRAYEFDPTGNIWYKLTSPNDYTLFMRATVKTLTAVAELDSKIPDKFEVSQNYPNPFNPSTTIRYSLPTDTDVNIKIYDINGNLIADLADNHQNAGTYSITWNGKNNSGNYVSSGVYYYRITAGNYNKTSKMMLLK